MEANELIANIIMINNLWAILQVQRDLKCDRKAVIRVNRQEICGKK